MTSGSWQAHRPARPPAAPAWLAALEPLTTGLLAQDGLRLFTWDDRAALGLRTGGVVYPVLPDPWDPAAEEGAREILGRVADLWCLMGPSAWVDRAEGLMPRSRVSQRVFYDFLVGPPGPVPVPGGAGELRADREADAEALFPLQEAYEKEEVLFDPSDFQPLASRLHFWKSLRAQELVSLWIEGRPAAKAATNALTPGWAQIGGVFTVPGRRGQGLQHRLMPFLMNRLWSQGRRSCLFVKKQNGPAGRLYRSLGFRESGDFTIVYGERRAWVPGFR